MSDETINVVLNACVVARTVRETAGPVRYRIGGDIGHPSLVLQQQFTVETFGGDGRVGSIAQEWRDVPVERGRP